MKKLINSISILLAAAALLTSCKNVEESDQYKQLQSRVDSLARANKQLAANYNETLDMLNEIESGFNEISAAESKLIALNLENQGDTVSRKDIMLNQVDKIKDKITEQQNKINNLQDQLSKSNAKNKTLTATITRMQKELDEKSAVIDQRTGQYCDILGKERGRIAGAERISARTHQEPGRRYECRALHLRYRG